jgi:tRNA G18 (ribose-2'-O)-methylase SpoU
MAKTELCVVLYNVRSAHNVGSIFRTAEGAGVREIFLVGYTPTPTDRFGRVREDIQKTSVGASDLVKWKHYETLDVCLDALRSRGMRIVAVEQTEGAIPYTEYVCTASTAFIFGNEIGGVPYDVTRQAGTTIYIPMHGTKESLNVAVAAGVILFSVCHQ